MMRTPPPVARRDWCWVDLRTETPAGRQCQWARLDLATGTVSAAPYLALRAVAERKAKAEGWARAPETVAVASAAAPAGLPETVRVVDRHGVPLATLAVRRAAR